MTVGFDSRPNVQPNPSTSSPHRTSAEPAEASSDRGRTLAAFCDGGPNFWLRKDSRYLSPQHGPKQPVVSRKLSTDSIISYRQPPVSAEGDSLNIRFNARCCCIRLDLNRDY